MRVSYDGTQVTFDADKPTSFTRDYLRSQVLELRERFGTLQFWSDPENQSNAIKALMFTYLGTADVTEDDEIMIQSTLNEMARRSAYAYVLGSG